MIQRVSIDNFRCLKGIDVTLKPLTVLVGPNDSGKSAFLAAIETAVSAVQNLNGMDLWRGQRDVPAYIRLTTSTGIYTVTNRGQERAGQYREPTLGRFHLPSQGVVMQGRGVSDEGGPPTIDINGGNIAALFDWLLRRDRERFFAARDTLRRLIPGLQDIHIGTPNPEHRRLVLYVENGLSIDADKSSTGVRLLLAFVAIAYHPYPPDLILIEEPEIGIHPKRLVDVMKLFREIIAGRHGEPAQLVLTTHSPYLLDLVNLETDQVLVFQRREDGHRSAEPVNKERLKHFLGEFLLGEVWYNESEKGIV